MFINLWDRLKFNMGYCFIESGDGGSQDAGGSDGSGDGGASTPTVEELQTKIAYLEGEARKSYGSRDNAKGELRTAQDRLAELEAAEEDRNNKKSEEAGEYDTLKKGLLEKVTAAEDKTADAESKYNGLLIKNKAVAELVKQNCKHPELIYREIESKLKLEGEGDALSVVGKDGKTLKELISSTLDNYKDLVAAPLPVQDGGGSESKSQINPTKVGELAAKIARKKEISELSQKRKLNDGERAEFNQLRREIKSLERKQ